MDARDSLPYCVASINESDVKLVPLKEVNGWAAVIYLNRNPGKLLKRLVVGELLTVEKENGDSEVYWMSVRDSRGKEIYSTQRRK